MTKRISLRKALQVKKTLVGDIARISSLLAKHNAQRYPNKHINVQALYDEHVAKVNELIHLKTELAKANVGIYGTIILADELKSGISFFEGLDTDEDGTEYIRGEAIRYTQTVVIDYAQKNGIIKGMKEKLEAALEAIDEYNSSHYIDILG